MNKDPGTAGKVVTADVSGGFDSYKEAVYEFLANLLSWLSTHQGVALIIILIVLGIMIYFIIKFRKFGKQIEKIIAGNKSEIGKKDALIEEQKNNLAALQKKLSDQQTVASEAMLTTIMTITGYDIGQLQIFFKFLTRISGNPLQIADTQANPMLENRQVEEESDDSAREHDGEMKIAPITVPPETAETDQVPLEIAEADQVSPEIAEADQVSPEAAEADKDLASKGKESGT